MKWYHYLIILIIPLDSSIKAQLTTYLENFNDDTLTNWDWGAYPDTARDQTTYTLTEANQILTIFYNRTDSSGEWDNFNFTPPQPVDVNANPVISLEVRSNVYTQLTLKPIYSGGKLRSDRRELIKRITLRMRRKQNHGNARYLS